MIAQKLRPIHDGTSLNSPENHKVPKYYEALGDDNLYHNIVHALSLLDSHTDPTANLNAIYTSSRVSAKHIKLLEGLALLLVSRGDDVTATGLLIEPDEVKIFWAKNSNTVATTTEKEYIREFLATLTRGTSVDALLNHVIPFCYGKIVASCKKLSATFNGSLLDGHHPRPHLFESHQEHPDYISLKSSLKRLGYIRTTSSLHGALKTFLELAANVTSESSPDRLGRVLVFAYAVTNINPTLVNLVTSKQWTCLRELGHYRLSCDRILRHLKSLPPQLSPKNLPQTVHISSNAITALNSWTKPYPHNAPIPSFQKLQLCYDTARPRSSVSTGTDTIIVSQHAELTIALHLASHMRSRNLKGTIEVGVSEASCYWCQVYSHYLNTWLKPGISLAFGADTGDAQCTAGWVVPRQPGDVRRKMLEHIGDETQRVFGEISRVEKREVREIERWDGGSLFGAG